MASGAQIPQASGFGDYIGSLVTVLLSLAVIIVLIVLFIKLLSRKNRLWQMNQGIRTIGGTGLGPNKSLQIVEVGDVVYVLGIGEDITLIDKVSDPEQAAQIVAAFQAAHAARHMTWPTGWRDWLDRLRNSRKQSTKQLDIEIHDADSSSVSFHEMFHAKLEQLPNRNRQVEQLLKDDTNSDR
ncbi:flagellar biosynthetic protein FliO [Paenibacillus sp. 481]|uniref:flagellar biosynthetic protein FliO n=1 Tax=Paenibacillus sp. 481 TaxID=2835869 RepID=UPI001E29DBDA|nr:flagellar biosynthetic protein FliO [Paenibacillus sp. 481]UHA73926.1 flagellar biosynthetic protein FliO [Paenibacillus sp. 481]